MKNPNFFILGAPKCGTTSLATWLSAHPNVYMPSVKEPFFFDTDERVIGRPTPEEYLEMFSGVQDHHIAIGEASTTYLHSRLAILNVLSSLDECPKFIACVRNPIEMAVSLHNHLLFHGIEPIDDFGRAWRNHGRYAGGSSVGPFKSHPNQIHYGPQCKLGEQIERLYRTVREALVLVLVFDDFVRDPRAEYSKVLRFLGLPDDGR